MFGCPLRSTVDRSSGSALRALSGMEWLLPDGGPFKVPGAAGVVGLGFGARVEGPAMGDALAAVDGVAVVTAEDEGATIAEVGGH